MPHALLSIGSNLGKRLQFLRTAVAEFVAGPAESGSCLVAASSVYETAPVGGPADQRRFLNAVLHIETALSARELLARIGDIERRAGRVRAIANGPRTLDIDILLFDDNRIGDEDLVVPHPRMHLRRFVLEPAAEVAGDWIHPTLLRSLRDLAETLRRNAGAQSAGEDIRRVAGPDWPDSRDDDA